MLLYKPVHHLVYDFHSGGHSEVTFADLDEAFDAADAANAENRVEPGESGYARVHTEYERDDTSGRHYRWTVDLTDEGDLHITDEPQRYPHQAIIRSVHPTSANEDQAPTFKPWYGNAAGTLVYKWQVSVVAKTRAAAYKSARHALGAHQAVTKATAAAAETVPEDAVLDQFIARRLGDEDNRTTPTVDRPAPAVDPRIRDGYDFPRTPRGYPYEGPQNTPGASNAVLPAVNGRTLAHHLDEDMTAMEGRVDLMERQFAGLLAKLGLVKVNDNPIIYRRLAPGGFQVGTLHIPDTITTLPEDAQSELRDIAAAWCNPDALAYDIADPAHTRLARELVGLIHHAMTSGDETHMDEFIAAFVGDPRIHPTAIPALTQAVGALVPIILTAMRSVIDPDDDGDRDE